MREYLGRHRRGCTSHGGLEIGWHLTSWGWSNRGQLGDGTAGNKTITTPTPAGSDTNWSAIAEGSHHTLALKSDGALDVTSYSPAA